MKGITCLPFGLVLVLIYNVYCSEPSKNNGNQYEGLTEREIILTLAKRIDDLEHSNSKLEKSHLVLEKWNKDHVKNIDILKKTVVQQKRKLVVLERILDRKCHESETPKKSGTPFKHPFHDTITEQAVGDNQIRRSPMGDVEIEAEHNRLKGNRISKRQEQSRYTGFQVAFFATASHHLTDLGVGQTLEFENVTTNIGQAYNPNTGIFTAPYGGTYVFSVSVMGAEKSMTHYYVAKNGLLISSLYVHGTESPYTTTSHTVILQLSKNDDVEIRNGDDGDDVWGNRYSCFSGFLLYPSDGDNSLIVG